ncbi:hypothetical protein EU522_01575, partial [Candidatus Thorarchaeota archaeon]
MISFEQVKALSAGDLVYPGDVMTGLLTTENDKDFYGIEIASPGLYNFTLVTYGETPAVANLRYYQNGYPYSGGASITSNGSRIVDILPDQIGARFTYQIAVYGELWWDASLPLTYTMRFDMLTQVDIATINAPLSHNFHQEGEQKWFLLRTGLSSVFPTLQAYKFRMDTNESGRVDWCFYQRDGLLHSYGSSLPNRTMVALLEAPEYYFRMESHSTEPCTVTASFEVTQLEALNPGDSLETNMEQSVESQRLRFYQLNLLEGVHYAISADSDPSVDISFKIHKGPASGAISLDFSDGGVGETEIVTDLVFWGQFSAYSYGMRSLGEPGRAELQLGMGWNGDLIDHSRIILELLAESGNGDVTLTVTEGIEAPTISGGDASTKPMDNHIGPYWCLLQLTDLQDMTIYDITMSHSTGTVYDFATSYSVFQSVRFDQEYLYNERRWLDGRSRVYAENKLDFEVYMLWDSYDSEENQTHLVYQPMAGDQWLLVHVPDIDVSSLMNGEVTISVQALPRLDAMVGFNQALDINENLAVVVRIPLEGGHTYGIEMAPINGSSYADCGLYNESGFFIPGQYQYSWYVPTPRNGDLRYNCYYIEATGLYAFIISGDGDAPVSV